MLGVAKLGYSHDNNSYCRAVYNEKGYIEEKVFVFMATRGLTYMLALFATIISYTKIIKFYRSLPDEMVKSFNSSKLLMYPIFQLIVYTPNSLQTLITIWTNTTPLWGAIIIITSSLSGFINFLVFGRQFLRSDSSQQNKKSIMKEDISFEESEDEREQSFELEC